MSDETQPRNSSGKRQHDDISNAERGGVPASAPKRTKTTEQTFSGAIPRELYEESNYDFNRYLAAYKTFCATSKKFRMLGMYMHRSVDSRAKDRVALVNDILVKFKAWIDGTTDKMVGPEAQFVTVVRELVPRLKSQIWDAVLKTTEQYGKELLEKRHLIPTGKEKWMKPLPGSGGGSGGDDEVLEIRDDDGDFASDSRSRAPAGRSINTTIPLVPPAKQAGRTATTAAATVTDDGDDPVPVPAKRPSRRARPETPSGPSGHIAVVKTEEDRKKFEAVEEEFRRVHDSASVMAREGYLVVREEDQLAIVTIPMIDPVASQPILLELERPEGTVDELHIRCTIGVIYAISQSSSGITTRSIGPTELTATYTVKVPSGYSIMAYNHGSFATHCGPQIVVTMNIMTPFTTATSTVVSKLLPMEEEVEEDDNDEAGTDDNGASDVIED